MPGHVLLVSLTIAAGAEDEYRRWHDRHLRQVVDAVDGVVSARRFELGPANEGQADGPRFIALYELEGDPADVRARLRAAAAAQTVAGPPPGIVESASSLVYEQR